MPPVLPTERIAHLSTAGDRLNKVRPTGGCPSTIGLLQESAPPGYARRSPTGSGPHERLTPGTLKSYFCPEAKDIVKRCAWGIVGARRGEPFSLLIRRQTRLSRGVKGIFVTGIAIAMLATSDRKSVV